MKELKLGLYPANKPDLVETLKGLVVCIEAAVERGDWPQTPLAGKWTVEVDLDACESRITWRPERWLS